VRPVISFEPRTTTQKGRDGNIGGNVQIATATASTPTLRFQNPKKVK